MHIRAPAIVCAVRPHAEHGAIARLLTPRDGLVAGYVRGGRSRRLRPVLLPGNIVEAEFRARSEDQLAGLTVELTQSRGALHTEPLAAAAIEWLAALTAATLPEGHPYPRIHAALEGVLAAIEAAPSARRWVVGLVRYELLLLSELGFGGADFGDVLRGGEAPGWPAILAVLRDTGAHLAEHLFAGHRADVMAARGRLLDRLERAVA
ncbi:MAG: recombination protein O N-terminal domain-containing protein [Sphingomonadaceae bacterium]|nr:recombination protein O N-terminal domain-containing protein [Sphingomonadaceae bacterium]